MTLPRDNQHLGDFADELHDGLLQYVIAARMTNEALRRKLAVERRPLPSEIDRIQELLDQAIDEGRHLLKMLQTGQQESTNLVHALQRLHVELSVSGTIQCELHVPDQIDVDAAASHVLFRVAQEGVSNIRRHSQAKSASITLQRQADWLELTIADDGQGFDPASVRDRHFGLAAMKRRVEALGGTFRLDTTPGRGSRVQVRIPAHRAPEPL
jgi:signal transduction histidine kinase